MPDNINFELRPNTRRCPRRGSCQTSTRAVTFGWFITLVTASHVPPHRSFFIGKDSQTAYAALERSLGWSTR